MPTLHSLLLQAPRREICVSSTSRPRCLRNSKLFLIGKLGNYLGRIRVSNPGQGFFLGGVGIRYTRWLFQICSMFTPKIGEMSYLTSLFFKGVETTTYSFLVTFSQLFSDLFDVKPLSIALKCFNYCLKLCLDF